MENKVRWYIRIILGLSIVAPGMIMCVPLVQITGTQEQKIGAYMIAIGFWISIIGQIILSFVCKKMLLQIEPKKYVFRKIYNSRVAITTFVTSSEARAADVLFLLATCLIIVILLVSVHDKWIIICAVSLWILSFDLHCVLNGKNYRCFKLLQTYKKEQEGNE